jgi:PTH2 family peptidyl-tRNA hydrolase
MVLVVREDLKMTKGKIGAQCGHATLGVFKQTLSFSKESEYWKVIMNKWNYDGG